jgi:hypothetical protein
VQDAQGELRRGGLAARAAAVRLEGVSEAAVGVAVGGDGVADGRGLAAGEEALEAPPVENARVRCEEAVGGGDDVGGRAGRGAHARIRPRRRGHVLHETAAARAH